MRRVIIMTLLFFSFYSCQNHDLWSFQKIEAENHNHNACKISSRSSKGLELEIMRGSYGQRCYLNVLKQKVLPAQGYTNRTNLIVTIENKPSIFIVDIMEGGQKLLLSNDASQTIIDALRTKKTLQIAIPNTLIHGQLKPSNFPKLYQQLQKFPAGKPVHPIKKIAKRVSLKIPGMY